MTTSDTSIVPEKFQLSKRTALYWSGAHATFLVSYMGLMAWGAGLKNYVNAADRERIGMNLFLVFFITLIMAIRESIPYFAMFVIPGFDMTAHSIGWDTGVYKHTASFKSSAEAAYLIAEIWLKFKDVDKAGE